MFLDAIIVRIINIALVLVILGLLYGIIFGESGVMRKNDLQQQYNTQQQKLHILQQQNTKKEYHISLLQDESMDLDMLEEQNRQYFNTHTADEIQIRLD